MDPNKTNLSESPDPSPAPSPVVATPSVVAPVAAPNPVAAAAPSPAPALKKARIGSMKSGFGAYWAVNCVEIWMLGLLQSTLSASPVIFRIRVCRSPPGNF